MYYAAVTASPIRPFPRFYEHYLGEHRNPTCRLLHFIGSWLVIAVVLAAIVTRRPLVLVAAPIVGYGFAGVGHFFFKTCRTYPALLVREALASRLKFVYVID